jgi:ankyrin repeat protein
MKEKVPKRNYYLVIPDEARAIICSYLNGNNNMVLNQALLHRESREALVHAYRGCVIRGFCFPNSGELGRYEDKDKNPEELWEGLKWALDRGIDVKDFTLSIPNEKPGFHMSWLLNMNRRAMALEVLARCDTSYDFNCGNHEGWTPLIYATIRRYPEIVEALCRKDGVNVDARTVSGRSALHVAISRDHVEEMCILLDVGNADIEGKNQSGQTPLHKAASDCKARCVEELLKRGADVNAVDNGGRTPLDKVAALDPYDKPEQPAVLALLDSMSALTSVGLLNQLAGRYSLGRL